MITLIKIKAYYLRGVGIDGEKDVESVDDVELEDDDENEVDSVSVVSADIALVRSVVKVVVVLGDAS